MGIVLYPYFLLVFWYHDFLPRSARRSIEAFIYVMELLSIPLLVSTFFQPLKSEYREGLVVFSVVMGVIVKSLILIASIFILSIVFVFLLSLNVLIAGLPLLLIILVI